MSQRTLRKNTEWRDSV